MAEGDDTGAPPHNEGEQTVAFHGDSGPRAYGICVIGSFFAPQINDGQVAIFDPDADPPTAGDPVAVWLVGASEASLVRLKLAIPPFSEDGGDVTPMLVVETGRGIRVKPMSQVARVDRFIGGGRSCLNLFARSHRKFGRLPLSPAGEQSAPEPFNTRRASTPATYSRSISTTADCVTGCSCSLT